MNKITLTLTAIFMFLFSVNAQNTEKLKAENYLTKQGELTFTFKVDNPEDIESLTKDMSLINYDSNTKTVKAWANTAQFRRFENLNIPYKVPKEENEVDEALIYDVSPLSSRSSFATLTFPVSSYPTYAQYAQQMQDFEDDYPALVEKFSIGTTGQGDKELLFVKISDNVSTDEQEPKLMLTSSMHGDEIAGYPMMLSLINYILTVYSNTSHPDHARIKNLVENTELWINPSANPDGTYHNSANNTSVVNARRGNGNNIDLNRNYPDNVAGPNYDGEAYQTETLAFMALADANHFVISANFHGGTELVNYPFDNAYSNQYVHSDNDWFEHIGVEYATHCQTDAISGGTSTPSYNNKASYMTDDDDWDNPGGAYPNNYAQSPGVTHGAEWYRVYGGRQDYMNFYQQCREITIELSDVKILQESSLDDYWYYNRDALIDFLTQGTYGFRGVVTDNATGNPVEANITLVGHDAYGSEIVNDLPFGDFYRPVKAGTYDIKIEAPCYQAVTLTNQTITDYQTLDLGTISLVSGPAVPSNVSAASVGSTTATIEWDSQLDSTFRLRYREVGATTWTIANNLVDNTYDITGLTELTDYEFQVRSSSNCNSTNSAYSPLMVFTTLEVSSCVGTEITAFPYLETFNSGIGDWTQDAGDDGDWFLDANGTVSGQTGPSDDITGGGNYFYTEASTVANGGIGSNATVILTSPCFNISNLTEGYFSFYYHMYGSDMGSLDLEITSDNGDNWTNVFTESGDKGDVWLLENIDLSSYLGQTVKFRFIGLTGNGFRSDIAIDNISLGNQILPDYCAVTAINDSDQLGIGRVQLNDLDNISDIEVYTDFTSASATVSKSTSHSLSITPLYNAATTNAVGYRAWIDFNRDGDFTDSGEEVFSQAPVTGGNTVTGNINIPANITSGDTRMRVAMSFGALPDPCTDFNFGEVEDYTVHLFNGLLYSNGIWTPNGPTAVTNTEDILILNGTSNVATDINVNSIKVNTGATFNVDKANSITVNNNIINSGEFILNSDSNEYSSLLLSGAVVGNIKYNRYVNSNAGGNDLISPPVSGESFVSFISNNSNILSNTAQTSYLFGPFEKPINEYQLYSSTEPTNLDVAKGYRAASTNNETFTFSGTVTTKALNVPIVKTGSNFDKWNLIGNPYTSYIKLSDFLAANITELDSQSAAVYGYDADASNGSKWTIWNLAYSDANPNTLIAPGQGFFVSSKTGGGNISFAPSMRTAGSSDDFIAGRTSTNTIVHSIIEMTTTDKTFGTEFYLTNNASLGLDAGYDAEHFGGAPTDFSIYSELTENSEDLDMAIQSIGLDDVNNNAVIPLGVNAAQGQQIIIAMVDSSIDYDVYLEDTATNTFTLLNTSEYSFTTSTALSGTGRFYLRFSANSLSTPEAQFEDLNIYSDSDLKQIIVSGQLNEDTELTLYDIQGRRIVNKALSINNNINTVSTSGFTKGVYLVQLKNNSSTITKKLILR